MCFVYYTGPCTLCHVASISVSITQVYRTWFMCIVYPRISLNIDCSKVSWKELLVDTIIRNRSFNIHQSYLFCIMLRCACIWNRCDSCCLAYCSFIESLWTRTVDNVRYQLVDSLPMYGLMTEQSVCTGQLYFSNTCTCIKINDTGAVYLYMMFGWLKVFRLVIDCLNLELKLPCAKFLILMLRWYMY